MTRARWARGLAVLLLPCLLLAACTGSDGGDGPPPSPGPTATAHPAGPPVPLRMQTDPSDAGRVEIGEVGFTVLEQRQSGSAVLVWAATFENTSRTDLLAYVDFELTWTNAAGESETHPWDDTSQQRSYDILPGQTAVIGGAKDVGFVPDRLDVSVHSDDWYPMRDLEAHGVPVGVAVTGFSIEVDTAVRVRADYTSMYGAQYVSSGEDLRLLVVQRDAAGELLGAAGAADFGVPQPGAGDQRGSVRLSQWPASADPTASEVVIMKVCCAWVGVT